MVTKITIMQKDEKGKVEDLLQELGKKIDQLIVDGKKVKDDLRDEVEEKIQELKKKKETLEEEFRSGKTNEKWKEARDHLGLAVDELRKAITSLFK